MKDDKTCWYMCCICFTVLVVGFVIIDKGYAVPASPEIHTLSQQDGTLIRARQWGDENCHGWETEDGYTIVFDENLKNWAYAVHDLTGKLISSLKVVGRDNLPAGCCLHLRHTKDFRSRNIQRRTSKKLSIESESYQKIVPSTGTANIPVILINFKDTATTYLQDDFNTLIFGSGVYSMKDYYEEVSYDKFSVSGGSSGVVGWYTASKNHDYYGKNNYSGDDSWPGDLVYEAVKAADADIDFSEYDMDNDGYVDVVNIIHQGTDEASSGKKTDIWSHSWSLDDAKYSGNSHYGAYTTNDKNTKGKKVIVNSYVIQAEKHSDGSQETIGVFAHEYGHALGLPDLYDTDYSSEGIGDWSLMAGGVYNEASRHGDRPAHLDAWSKYFLGWVIPTKVVGTLVNEPITEASVAPDVYQLLTGDPLSGEYFLVENRQKSGFDVGLPGTGLLIWHVDGNTISDNIPNDTVNDIECKQQNKCANNHYGVALMQADGMWDLEKNRNSGDEKDPYSKDTGTTSFTDVSSPNSKLYDGSDRGVGVTEISNSASTMTATLSVCKAKKIKADLQSLNLEQGESGVVTITLTGKSGCKSAGKTVKAKVTLGKKRISSVLPVSAITDANGEAQFTITAGEKTGNAQMRFKSGNLKRLVKVTVEKSP